MTSNPFLLSGGAPTPPSPAQHNPFLAGTPTPATPTATPTVATQHATTPVNPFLGNVASPEHHDASTLGGKFLSGMKEVSDVVTFPYALVQAVIADNLQTPENTPPPPPTQYHGNIGQRIWEWMNSQNGPHMNQLEKDVQAGGPAQVADYDIYPEKGSLERVLHNPQESEHAKAVARYYEKHPWVAGGVDVAGQMVANPTNYVGSFVGGAAKALGLVPKVGLGLDEAQAVLGIGNRWAGLRAAARTYAMKQGLSWGDQAEAAARAEQFGRSILGGMHGADKLANDQVASIADGLTKNEWHEVIHRMQGNPGASGASFSPAREAVIDERAAQLKNLVWDVTRAQLKSNVLDIARVYGKDQLFPGVFAPIEAGEGSATRAVDLTDTQMREIMERARSGYRPTYASRPVEGGAPGEMTSDLTPSANPDIAREQAVLNDQLNARADMMHDILTAKEPPPNGSPFYYFPMRGATQDPSLDDETQEYLEHYYGGGGGRPGIRKDTGAQNAPRRQYTTLQDLQENAKAQLRKGWDPAESLVRWASQRYRNAALEDAMTELTYGGKYADLGLLRDEGKLGYGFAPVASVAAARNFGSEALRRKVAAQGLLNYITELGGTIGEAKQWLQTTTGIGQLADIVGPNGTFWRGGQNLLRQGVVANPMVHGLWNLGTQFLASGGSLRDLAIMFADAVKQFGAHVASGKPWAEFTPEGGAFDLARQEGAITARGAPKTIGGHSATALLAKPWRELGMADKLGKAAALASEWNQNIVFEMMEPIYASALMRSFLRKGMSKAAASNAVRRALGDYANVSNLGVDAMLNKVFFFYPWLKTILPFWLKTTATHPQYVNSYYRGTQTVNELSGDPNAWSGNETPFAHYVGMQNGRPEYFTPTTPMNVTSELADIAQGFSTTNVPEWTRGVRRLVLDRLSPIARSVYALGQQLLKGPTEPYGPLGYAPPQAKLVQLVQGFGDYIPGPARAAGQFALALSGHATFTPAAMAGLVLGGAGYVSTTPQQSLAQTKIESAWLRRIDTAIKRGDKTLAWRYYTMMQTQLAAKGLTPTPPKRERADETNMSPVQLESGAQAETPETPPSTPTAPPAATNPFTLPTTTSGP